MNGAFLNRAFLVRGLKLNWLCLPKRATIASPKWTANNSTSSWRHKCTQTKEIYLDRRVWLTQKAITSEEKSNCFLSFLDNWERKNQSAFCKIRRKWWRCKVPIFPAAFELDHHEQFGHVTHFGISEVVKWTAWRLLCEIMRFEDVQSWTSPTWLTVGSDHKRFSSSSKFLALLWLLSVISLQQFLWRRIRKYVFG